MRETQVIDRSLTILFMILGLAFISIVGFTAWFWPNIKASEVSTTGFHHEHEHTDPSKLPRLTADKKTLVVTSEEALPTAFEFLRLNMYLPIKKIVLMKPGSNDTVKVYPIPREGMIGLGENNVTLSIYEVGFIVLFLVFIVGAFCCIVFTNINSSSRVFSDEELICMYSQIRNIYSDDDADDLLEEDRIIYEKVKAERKRKEIEGV